LYTSPSFLYSSQNVFAKKLWHFWHFPVFLGPQPVFKVPKCHGIILAHVSGWAGLSGYSVSPGFPVSAQSYLPIAQKKLPDISVRQPLFIQKLMLLTLLPRSQRPSRHRSGRSADPAERRPGNLRHPADPAVHPAELRTSQRWLPGKRC